jgi:hypothetical protein
MGSGELVDAMGCDWQFASKGACPAHTATQPPPLLRLLLGSSQLRKMGVSAYGNPHCRYNTAQRPLGAPWVRLELWLRSDSGRRPSAWVTRDSGSACAWLSADALAMGRLSAARGRRA